MIIEDKRGVGTIAQQLVVAIGFVGEDSAARCAFPFYVAGVRALNAFDITEEGLVVVMPLSLRH